jgi:trigger factor
VKTTLADVGPWQKAIEITLDREEVEREMDRMVSSYRTRAVLPGFRKGKVPDQVVRSHFRDNLESDLLNHLLPEATEKAIAEHQLQIAAPPRIKDLSFRSGEPLTFTAVVDLWPVVDVQGYRGLELEETVTEIDDEMVDEFLRALQERAASFTPVLRPAAEGDVVEASIVPVDLNGQRLPRGKRQVVRMEAGGASLLPEFRAVSMGAQTGEEKVVRITYPEDFGDRDLAGQTRHYRMHVKQILEKKLPELDDAFAGRVDGLPGLEALRAKIRLRLEADERMRGRERTEELLVDRLLERNSFEVPDGIIERSLARALEKAREERPDIDETEFRETYRPLVVRLRRREILLESVARQETIEVGEEELNAGLARSAPAGVDPQVVRRRLEREGELDRVREDLRERKALDFLLEQASVRRVVQPRPRKSNLILP